MTATAAGLYLHVPFCSVRCPFCNFAITTALDDRDGWLRALEVEMALRAPGWATVGFDSVYLGGGTPSLLPPKMVERILLGLRAHFDIDPDAEVTLEANPGDFDATAAIRLRRAGVNRLSLGVQSLDDGDLRFLGREHDAVAARDAFGDARAAGFENITIDLIYGLPGRTHDDWKVQIEAATALGPDHITAYSLTYEPGTRLTRQRDAGEFREPTDGEARDLFVFTHDEMKRHGFTAYEVSAFARAEPFRSRHNRKYWEDIPYLGLGPSAHSYRNGTRFWNTPQVQRYIRRLAAGELAQTGEEHLESTDKKLELLFLRLRTTSGLSLDAFREEFGADLRDTHRVLLGSLVRDGLATLNGTTLRLRTSGLAMADGIATRLAAAPGDTVNPCGEKAPDASTPY